MMDRNQRFEQLAALPEADAQRLADQALQRAMGSPGTPQMSETPKMSETRRANGGHAGHAGGVEVVVAPTVGMVMARVADGAKGEHFNLAEVLVTEARVSLGGYDGWGLVMGRRPEHALAVAIADAAAEASAGARELLERELEVLAHQAETAEACEWATLAPTRVDFDTL